MCHINPTLNFILFHWNIIHCTRCAMFWDQSIFFPIKQHIHWIAPACLSGAGVLASYTVIHLTIYSCDKQARITPLVGVKNLNTSLVVFPVLPCSYFTPAGWKGELSLRKRQILRWCLFLALTSSLQAKLVFISIPSAIDIFPDLFQFHFWSKTRQSANHPQVNVFYTACAALNWKLEGREWCKIAFCVSRSRGQLQQAEWYKLRETHIFILCHLQQRFNLNI